MWERIIFSEFLSHIFVKNFGGFEPVPRTCAASRHLQAVSRRPQLHRVPAHIHRREVGQRERLRVRVRAGVCV